MISNNMQLTRNCIFNQALLKEIIFEHKYPQRKNYYLLFIYNESNNASQLTRQIGTHI